MSQGKTHVSVCVCTYKRPQYLEILLRKLANQDTRGGRFSYSIVVADNDRSESAKEIVAKFASTSPIELTYCVEPEQNISLVRNRALQYAKGEYIACIDDDEFPASDWLSNAIETCQKLRVDGVLGPVRPTFTTEPPAWVIKGRFCERASYETGFILPWKQTTTANVLIRRQILDGVEEPFRKQFGSGCEDSDFFKRMVERGYAFAWCNEAVVHEFVPPQRWKRRYLLKRALLRGQNNRHFADFHGTLKSLLAIPLYSMLLPFLLLCGHHLFLRYLVKICDHAGKLFGILGLRPMGDKYLAG